MDHYQVSISVSSRFLQRLAVMATQVAVLFTLSLELDGEHFWALASILALTICAEFLAHRSGINEGIASYLHCSPSEQAEIRKLYQQVEEPANDQE
jgi:hypothetical protein